MSLTAYPTLRLKLTMPQALKLQFLPAVPGSNAAASAAAAAASAEQAAASAAQAGNKVDRTGDTMTGFLTLNANPTAPLQAATKAYVDAAGGGGGGAFLPLIGGTLTGDLTISKVSPALRLNTTDTSPDFVIFQRAGLVRWSLMTPGTESGSNTGSDIALTRFTDAGAGIDTPFTISRATGEMLLTKPLTLPTTSNPTLPAHAATKQYVDSKIGGSGTPTSGQYAKWVNALTIQGVSAATALGDIGAQPLDGDLTSLAAAAGTNTIYYRSGTDTWSPVVVSTGLAFSGGNLTATAGGGNVSNNGTPAANDVAQWVTSTTIKGVPLATWRTTPTFYNILNVLSAAGGDGAYLRGLSGQGWVYAEGASADISLVLSSKGNGVITFYNGNFTRICAQFTSVSGSNTFPTFTAQASSSTLGNNLTTNPIIMTSELRLLGVTSGASAAAGVVGEEIIFRRDFSARLGLSNAAYNIVGSIALTAGEWELSYSSGYHAEAAPTANAVQSSLSTSSTTPAGDADGGIGGPLFAGGSIYAVGFISMNCPEYTVRLTSARTYYLLMWHNLGGAVPTYGTCYVRARRVR